MEKIKLTESEFISVIRNTVARVLKENSEQKPLTENVSEPKKIKIKMSELKEAIKNAIQEEYAYPNFEENIPGQMPEVQSQEPLNIIDQAIEKAGGNESWQNLSSEEKNSIIGELGTSSMDQQNEMDEEAKPSAGLSAKERSSVVKKAKAGEDIGKSGKGFKKVADKAAKEYGSKEAGERVAAASMWKNMKR